MATTTTASAGRATGLALATPAPHTPPAGTPAVAIALRKQFPAATTLRKQFPAAIILPVQFLAATTFPASSQAAGTRPLHCPTVAVILAAAVACTLRLDPR